MESAGRRRSSVVPIVDAFELSRGLAAGETPSISSSCHTRRMTQRKTVVITGSTRGIGLGMAQAFLERDHEVMISGRNSSTVAATCEQLSLRFAGRVAGCACDVTDPAAVEQLWAHAQREFGRVDIWINNAGMGQPSVAITKLDPETASQLIQTNVLGTMYGTAAALRGMKAQGGGHVFNMEGLGSDGRRVVGNAVYGTSKRAVRYFTRAVIDETKGDVVNVGTLSPGIVWTELLEQGLAPLPASERARAERVFAVLADEVDVVAPWLVEQILNEPPHGGHIGWLTTRKILWRFATARFRARPRRRVTSSVGEAIDQSKDHGR